MSGTGSTTERRGLLVTLIVVLTLVPGAAALAAVVGAPNAGGLVAVGPVNPENGFPVWYRDAGGVTLQECLSADPSCALAAAAEPGFDPAQPVVFPTNYPSEAFYWRGVNVQNTSVGKFTTTLALEGAFVNGPVAPGDQTTFARIRFVGALPTTAPGNTYTVTHPYGTDSFVADAAGPRALSFTEDVPVGVPGAFAAPLKSRLGPFLRWTSGAPAGFVGDAATPHAVVGSPTGNNLVRVQGKDIGAPGAANLCPPGVSTSGVATDCIQDNLFVVTGQLATNRGGQPDRAVYSRTSTGGGQIHVFAHSDANQAIQIARDATAGLATTPLVGSGLNYFGLAAYTGPRPIAVTVQNAGDQPVSRSTIPLVDEVAVTRASYDASARTLTVDATSSDQAPAPDAPALTVTGFGPLTAHPTVFGNVALPPLNTTVTSSAGGTTTTATATGGTGFAPVPVQATALAPATVPVGAPVTLDGSASTGDIDTFAWTQLTGPPVTITGGGTAKAGFTAPSTPGALSFRLTVTGPPGSSSQDVTVNATAQPLVATAVATPSPAPVGATVALDGTGSTGALGYAWTQTAGPAVTITNATAATASFVMPSAATTFRLTVTGQGGATQTATVTVTPVPDTLTITKAEYRTGTSQYRITGTATAPLPDAVTITLNDAAHTVIASSVAVVAGAPQTWDFHPTTTAPRPGVTSITVTSSRGGSVTGTLTIRA